MRLLLVEDEEVLGRFTAQALTRGGFAVDWVTTGGEAVAATRAHEYDAVVLDLGLPDMLGEVLVREVRAQRASTVVIILTARGQIHDRIAVLDLGADDYMVKPCDVNELLARIRAVKRRMATTSRNDELHRIGPLELSVASRTVRWNNAIVPLTAREFDVLCALVVRRPRVVSRAQLEEAVYGWGDEVDSNSIEVYIHFLRRKLSPKVIVNVRSRGYQIGAEEVLAAEAQVKSR
jgi:DNA-binding response OmpR family regulator